MKLKIKIVLCLLLAVISLAVVACDKEDKDIQNIKPPKSETLTFEQFDQKAEQFTDISNYITGNITGYTFNLNFKTQVQSSRTEFITEGILDISEINDVKLSVYFNGQFDRPKSDQSGGDDKGSGGTTIAEVMDTQKIEANAYLYSQNLYVDYKINNGQTERDSISGINNDLTTLMDSLFPNDFPGGTINKADFAIDSPIKDFPIEDILDILTQFQQNTTITYYETFGHYILETEYPGGQIEGSYIDSFEMSVDLYEKNSRITEIRVNYNAPTVILQLQIAEKKVNQTIDLPDDPSLYNGTFLDEVEDFLNNDSLKLTDFYGEWSNANGNIKVTVSESAVSVKNIDALTTYTEFYQYSFYLLLVNEEQPYLFKRVSDDSAVIINLLNDEVITLTKKATEDKTE